MFKFNQLRQIHLEISSKCQASCPMCARNIHGGLPNPLLKEVNWTIDEFMYIINEEVLNQIDYIYFCGNFGDPVMNQDLPMMCKYLKDKNPNIYVKIHTNGGIQNKQWWEKLAQHLPKRHAVVFAIDGLEDTNHLYRIGVNYNKVIDNASAFIQAGGIAEWAFLEFQHNEHQVGEAKLIASEMGFKHFNHKQSNRFVINNREFEVYDKNGNTEYTLKPATESKIVFIDKSYIQKYKEIINSSEISCIAHHTKEVFIDAFKNMTPCCFIGAVPNIYYDNTGEIYHIKKEIRMQYDDYVSKFNGDENINCMNRSIKEIIESEPYQTIWDEYWKGDDRMIMCAKSCGKNMLSKSADQFL